MLRHLEDIRDIKSASKINLSLMHVHQRTLRQIYTSITQYTIIIHLYTDHNTHFYNYNTSPTTVSKIIKIIDNYISHTVYTKWRYMYVVYVDGEPVQLVASTGKPVQLTLCICRSLLCTSMFHCVLFSLSLCLCMCVVCICVCACITCVCMGLYRTSPLSLILLGHKRYAQGRII